MNNWYVYQHIREDTNTVFYIGIGHTKNFRRAYDSRCRNSIWKSITSKVSWRVEILHQDITKEMACTIEVDLIKKFGRKNKNTGILANMTDGGEANAGRIVSDEVKKKLSESRIGANNPFYGKHHTKEHKEKLSELNSGENHPNYGKHHTLESRKKISNAGIGREVSKYTREKRSLNTPLSKQIDVWEYDTGNYIGRYRSATHAAKELNLSRYEMIARVARGERVQTSGYMAKYVLNSELTL